jgi:hypothetical protein
MNDTTAGLPEQERAIASWKEHGQKYDYEEACCQLESAGLLHVNIPENAKALGGFVNQEALFWEDGRSYYRSEPAPVDARYKYGSRWIYSAIPDEVLAEIRGWAELPPQQPLHLDQAQAFLDQHKLKLRTTYKADKCPLWCDGNCQHGDRYRITISRKAESRLSFDFWNSQNDSAEGKEPTAYDVLACISSEVHCPNTFSEFCSEFGYDEDSRKAPAMFRRCDSFATRLRAFFTEEELKALSEIN